MHRAARAPLALPSGPAAGPDERDHARARLRPARALRRRLPYFYLRGAPPSGTSYVYDDIVVPALFHLAAGPAVIHPQMVGTIDVHSGVAPARYGGHSGGVVVGHGPPARREDVFGEAEIRAIDANGFVQGRTGPSSLAAAGRSGYPGPLVSALTPDIDLATGTTRRAAGSSSAGATASSSSASASTTRS